MLHITVSCAGRLDKPYWVQACDEYAKRLSRFCKLEFFQTGDREQPRRFEKLRSVALCIDGDQYTSVEFAGMLRDWQNYGTTGICFYIGGSDGLSPEFISGCDQRLSLSAMTWPHAAARVLLLEQLYRGFQILANSSYHK